MADPSPNPAPLSETELDELENVSLWGYERRLLATVRALQQQQATMRLMLQAAYRELRATTYAETPQFKPLADQIETALQEPHAD